MPKVSQKSPQELYQERLKRVNDCLAMKVPDRVPLEIAFGYFPARYYPGITCETAYYDYDKWLAASKKVVMDFGADWSSVQNYFPGQVLELIDPKSLAWPGHGTSALHSHQAIEGEFMKGDEYGGFLGDHTDFMLRSYLPRISGAMAPFAKMPSLANAMGGYMGALSVAMGFSDPEIARSIETLQKAGSIMRQRRTQNGWHYPRIRKIGFSQFCNWNGHSSF